jgi:pyruvate dehydrogenase E1 component beta subunit
VVAAEQGSQNKLGHSLNAALQRAMSRDDSVVLLGEDIGRLGGVFRITRGLREKFGEARVMDFVLAESSIVGAAIGLSLSGLRPVCEIQFESFIYPAMNQLVTQAARMQLRLGEHSVLPLVVRVPFGGRFRGVEHHNESNEVLFAATAGLSVVACSSSADAGALLELAISMDSPVLFFEPKRLYWRATQLPEMAPHDVGTGARVVAEGDHVTVVSYGASLIDCWNARDKIGAEVSVELIDLRWLRPLDIDCVARSVRKTGKLIVVHEASKFCGIGAEIAAEISSVCFRELRAPVVRIAADDRPYPPSAFEQEFLPGEREILAAIVDLGGVA